MVRKDDDSFSNIELGAGCGNFGEQFHPKCYLTEEDINVGARCGNAGHIHFYCSAYATGCAENRFDTVIMSNPHGYGFNDVSNAERLIEELYRILRTGAIGKIIIVCNDTNRFCSPDRVIKRLNDDLGFVHIRRPIMVENINPAVDYPGFEFRQTNGILPAFPNKRITIDVIK